MQNYDTGQHPWEQPQLAGPPQPLEQPQADMQANPELQPGMGSPMDPSKQLQPDMSGDPNMQPGIQPGMPASYGAGPPMGQQNPDQPPMDQQQETRRQLLKEGIDDDTQKEMIYNDILEQQGDVICFACIYAENSVMWFIVINIVCIMTNIGQIIVSLKQTKYTNWATTAWIMIITCGVVGIVQLIFITAFIQYSQLDAMQKNSKARQVLVDNFKWGYLAYFLSIGCIISYVVGNNQIGPEYIVVELSGLKFNYKGHIIKQVIQIVSGCFFLYLFQSNYKQWVEETKAYEQGAGQTQQQVQMAQIQPNQV